MIIPELFSKDFCENTPESIYNTKSLKQIAKKMLEDERTS